jgi:iron complex transport system substrate-binding protein
VASACGVSARGDALVAGLRDRLRRVASLHNGARPRVAVIEWLAPPMLAAHWVPDAIEAAGGEAVGAEAGVASPYVAWDAIRALRPDAAIVAACGFDLPRTIAEAEPMRERILETAPRVLLIDGNAYLNRPGPRLVEAVEEIAAWLAGGPPDPARGLAWTRP